MDLGFSLFEALGHMLKPLILLLGGGGGGANAQEPKRPEVYVDHMAAGQQHKVAIVAIFHLPIHAARLSPYYGYHATSHWAAQKR